MRGNFQLKLPSKADGVKEIALCLDDANPNEAHILSFLRGGMAYEPDITRIVQRILEPGDVFVDIGANIGYFTLLGSALVGGEGRVIAFEPDPKNIDRIHFHCGNNTALNVEVIANPASHCVEDVRFYFNQASSGGNALWNPNDIEASEENGVSTIMRATTLAQELTRRGINKVKLVKIDTEGAEHSILRGAKNWLENQSIPFIIAELNSFGLAQLDSSTEKLLNFMYDKGYLAFLLYYDGRPPQFISPGTEIHTTCISNILFTTPTGFSQIWTSISHNPGVVINKITGQPHIAA